MSTAAATERQISYLSSLINKALAAIQTEDPTYAATYTSDHAAAYVRNADLTTRNWATSHFMASDIRGAIVDAVRSGKITTDEAHEQLTAAWATWTDSIANTLTANIADLTATEASQMIDLLK